MSADDELFDRVGGVLTSHDPCWHYEPSTSPGGAPSWCLDPGGQITVSVTVIDGAIAIYLPAEDKEIPLADPEALTAWITANQARFVRP